MLTSGLTKSLTRNVVYSAVTYDWYCDSENGNDANLGFSQNQAIKTLAKLQTLIKAGDTVGLRRNSTWREQLDLESFSAHNKPSIYAYGSGNRPKIIGRDIVPGGWIKTPGYDNIYQISWINNFAQTDQRFHSVWEDGAVLYEYPDSKGVDTLGTVLTAMDGTSGAFYIPDRATFSAGGATDIYLHAGDSNNPNSNGKVYEISKRDFGIRFADKIEGIHGIAAAHDDGALVGYEIVDCFAEDGITHNLLCVPHPVSGKAICRDTTSKNVRADKDLLDGQFAAGIILFHSSNEFDFYGTIENCTSIQDDNLETALRSHQVGPFGAHAGASNGDKYKSLTMKNCVAEGRYLNAFSTGGAHTVICDGLSIDACGFGLDVSTGTTELRVTNSYFAGISEVYRCAAAISGTISPGAILVIEGNVFNIYRGIGVSLPTTDLTATIRYNTFADGYMGGNSTGVYINHDDNAVTLSNNIFSGWYNPVNYDNTPATLSGDNNIYHNISGGNIISTVIKSFADWKTETGIDGNSSELNPSFENLPSTWMQVSDATTTAAIVDTLQAGTEHYS